MMGGLVRSCNARPPVQTSDGSWEAPGWGWTPPPCNEPTAQGPIPSPGQGKLRHAQHAPQASPHQKPTWGHLAPPRPRLQLQLPGGEKRTYLNFNTQNMFALAPG